MSKGKAKDNTIAEKQHLTLAQELAQALNEPDADNPSLTIRQAICRAIIDKAREGDLKAVAWLYEMSGEQQREKDRQTEIWRKTHGF